MPFCSAPACCGKTGQACLGRRSWRWRAVVAFADGFWLTSLRGAVGAIERTQSPFTTWWHESSLSLPIFVFAVLGALILAKRWFGPVLRKPTAIVGATLIVVAASDDRGHRRTGGEFGL